MKVTIVHQYFKHPSEGGAIRSYYLAKGLLENNHDVEVITTHNRKTLHIKRIDGIKVFYLPIYYDNTLGKYQRLMAFIKFVFQSIRVIHQNKRPQLLYVISTPLTVGVVALWTKLFLRIRYVFEIGDLWPEAPIQLGYIKNPLLKRTLYWFEKVVYNQAYKIVAMSPDIEKIIEKGNKVIMIPNMADCEFFVPESKSSELLDLFGISDEFVIAYLGAAGKANHLTYLLDAAKALQNCCLNVKILVAATGSELEHFRMEVLSTTLNNVTITSFTNKGGVKELLSISDAVYVSFAGVPILASGSPNKFFDGLAAGKIIITNFEGWIKKEIETTQCGFCYTPTNTDEFIQKLIPFIEDDTLRKQAQLNARNLAEKKFSRKGLIEEWVKLFEKT
ncbi:MAG: glycosyltransferase family 4 protein [Cyclobacteriaceae bacterium]|nr:glycosyltransferase family 4 protein [Cyclobacteriaceae bacterium]